LNITLRRQSKILYTTDEPEILLSYFKDDATAFNAQKRGSIAGEEINCTISTALFQYLEERGIPTHFIDCCPSPNQMRVRALRILPLEVVVRNIAAGSLCQQTVASGHRSETAAGGVLLQMINGRSFVDARSPLVAGTSHSRTG